MAGMVPSATVCEMIGDDGKALSKVRAAEYGRKHGLTFLVGADIIEAWRGLRSR
jgi:3,4-dihydroxy 2-butanone 4-phosphate synthase